MTDKLLTWDTSISIGDYVYSTYSKSQSYSFYKVMKIQRRFLTKEDMMYEVYRNDSVGDEYNPLITIERAISLDFSFKEIKATKLVLDGDYLIKVSKSDVDSYIKRLTKDLSVIK